MNARESKQDNPVILCRDSTYYLIVQLIARLSIQLAMLKNFIAIDTSKSRRRSGRRAGERIFEVYEKI